MNGFDFLSTARELSAKTQPADHRSAVSRAYYAAYNGLLQHVLNNGIPRLELGLSGARKGNSHGALETELRHIGQHSVANDLKALRMNRIDADYLHRQASDDDIRAMIPDTLDLADRIHAFAEDSNCNIRQAWSEHVQRLDSARKRAK